MKRKLRRRGRIAAIVLLCLSFLSVVPACAQNYGRAERSALADSAAHMGEVVFAAGSFGADSGRFSDVAEGKWYAATIREMTQAGWISGYRDGTFRPSQPISGAEFVTIVAKCAGLSPGHGQSSHWAAGTMQAALDAHWYDWDELPPTGERYNQPISRQLAVKIVMKALLPQARGEYGTEAAKIKDLQALDGRYYEAVFAAYRSGVVAGDNAGNFHAREGLSRAEACAIIQNALRCKENAAGTAVPGGASGPQSGAPGSNSSSAGSSEKGGNSVAAGTDNSGAGTTVIRGGVSENGWLQVIGTQLCNEAGKPVVLRGMSSHGLQWFGEFASAKSIANTAQYGANLFRAAMYTSEGGYLSRPEEMWQQLTATVDAAIVNDMYVIIDWHILSDGNPMDHLQEAKAFFSQMARRYKDTPAVLFEICNEPNGGATWSGSIKPYAEQIVAAIREQSPKAVILIGSSTWSQDVHLAAADPVAGSNLMYTCHFYAGTHGQWLRQRIDDAMKQGLPIFVSEWGTSAADGSGGVFLEEARRWTEFMKERNISWANWSLCDKNETSAALRPGTNPSGGFGESDLSDSGQFVFSQFR